MAQPILTKRQVGFLKQLSQIQELTQKFYLTGGTALAGFYLQHRFSEDLDFFSETEIDVETLNVFLKTIQPEFPFQEVDFQQSYNRNLFFLHFDDEVLKTEFTYFPFSPIAEGKKEYGVRLDSLRDIAVNKLFTIYQQVRARDYIDLYCICRVQGWGIRDLARQARIKFDSHIDPLQLGTQFTKVTEAKDYPRLVQKLDPKSWQNFFLEEAKKLKPEILA